MDDEEVLANKDPEFIRATIDTVLGTIQLYGWFILGIVVGAVILYNRFKPSLSSWSQQQEDARYKKMDVGAAQSRLEAMERARMKMQAELDAQAKDYAERQKVKEEEKRKQKIEDWDRHLEGKGYRSKTKAPQEQPPPPTSGKPKAKKALKPEYNPLMGDMGGACFRPPRRGGAAGGG